MTDTSAEAVERLAAFHALSVDRYDADEESGLRACAHMTAATLRALLAERDRLEAEVASLRLTLGGKTFSADVPDPIGCPLPGACVQVAEIDRLRDALHAALRAHDIVAAEHPSPNRPVWVDVARAAFKETGHE